ncbi:MAG TPA: Nif11-like leader peptide family natural product precursor [Roseomonas sp.]|jgi:predicted ribosomally synthesized peptide with nif11-like leader
MSQQTLIEFRNFVASNPALVERLKGTTDPHKFAEEAGKVARENGFSVSPAELEAALTSPSSGASGELKDEQLVSVAGGGGAKTIEDTVCMKLYGWCP